MRRFIWLAVLGLLFVNAAIWYASLTSEKENVLSVSYLDIGQGDGIFIQAPNGNQMMIDAGPSAGVSRKLREVMPFYDRSIDVIIATHPDKDHIGGFPKVLEAYDVAYAFEPGSVSDNGVWKTLEADIAKEPGAKHILARRGMAISLGSGVLLTILYPDSNASHMDTNDSSIVAKLTYGSTCFLFTGDSPVSVEEYLVHLNQKELQCDVLKAGHHGSRTSTSEDYINAVAPRYAVISAGKHNQYGHPHKEVVDRLVAHDIKILRTDEMGTVTLLSDGKNIEIK